jgi:hypothetical protein
MRELSRLAGLAGISPACAVLGGLVDEHTHLGFTNWQSACRASGLSVRSVTYFTFELLPSAVLGALLGGLLVLLLAFVSRHRAQNARRCLAAHAGCALAMPLGLVLCAMALPVPLMLVAEVALAVTAAWFVQALNPRHFATRVLLHP